jgi:hypothetical protein
MQLEVTFNANSKHFMVRFRDDDIIVIPLVDNMQLSSLMSKMYISKTGEIMEIVICNLYNNNFGGHMGDPFILIKSAGCIFTNPPIEPYVLQGELGNIIVSGYKLVNLIKN